jgi:hypothetical protein
VQAGRRGAASGGKSDLAHNSLAELLIAQRVDDDGAAVSGKALGHVQCGSAELEQLDRLAGFADLLEQTPGGDEADGVVAVVGIAKARNQGRFSSSGGGW